MVVTVVMVVYSCPPCLLCTPMHITTIVVHPDRVVRCPFHMGMIVYKCMKCVRHVHSANPLATCIIMHDFSYELTPLTTCIIMHVYVMS